MARCCPGRHAATAALLTLSVVVAACAPPPPPVRSRPSGWTEAVLTRDGADTFTLTGDSRGLNVAADARNVGGDTRLIAWATGLTPSRSGTACVTLGASRWPAQEGVALAINSHAGRTTAVTVTKNVWGRATTVFNVHRWDTASSSTFTQLASHDMAPAMHDRTGAGHRLCARVEGDRLAFKVWHVGRAEPAWSDGTAARAAPLPPELRRPGWPGVYFGHVEPGGTLGVRDIDLRSGPGTGTAPTTAAPTTTAPTTTAAPTTTLPDLPDLPADEEPGAPDDGESDAS